MPSIPSPEPVTSTSTSTPSSTTTPTVVAAVSTNAVTGDIMTAVGDYVGLFIGLGFIVLGIVILVLSNNKVKDAVHKTAGAAATLNPELAGAAVATSVLTGHNVRQRNVTQAARNMQKKPTPKNKGVAAKGNLDRSVAVPAKPKEPTRLYKTESAFSVPSSPRAERNFD